jgi:hypothetical protein
VADFNAASLSSSRRCRVGRSLWKVLTSLSDLYSCRAFGPAFFFLGFKQRIVESGKPVPTFRCAARWVRTML